MVPVPAMEFLLCTNYTFQAYFLSCSLIIFDYLLFPVSLEETLKFIFSFTNWTFLSKTEDIHSFIGSEHGKCISFFLSFLFFGKCISNFYPVFPDLWFFLAYAVNSHFGDEISSSVLLGKILQIFLKCSLFAYDKYILIQFSRKG